MIMVGLNDCKEDRAWSLNVMFFEAKVGGRWNEIIKIY